uniref:disease resistance protein RUN1-like n=1 Tax=Erigeron canadensis TaxID=72917 RepID=UPI001CB9125C|nr:disease resistance protein RUN1-like [Erigeron canadensis]
MASSSSSSSSKYSISKSHPSSFSYDVFLSFRGEDTRKTFTDHLYRGLRQAGIRTFRDDDGMERGKLLKPELEKAIHESQVSLIVFSKNYATSKWCLDEVLMIMEEFDRRSSAKRQVVPVFYNIDPTDVRNQTGCFEQAFKGYEDEVTREKDAQRKMKLSEKVKAWRGSLTKAGSLTGMVHGEDGYEAEFISDIVNDIRKKVDYNALYIKDKLVGMKENVAEIESWLQDPSPNSTILLIDGIGGIGKTTIAKLIFNMNYREFDGCCFLRNIRKISNQQNGLLRLQRQLLSSIFKSQQKETIWNEDEGTTKIINAINKKKVLLVLDDVSTPSQLESLLGPQTFYSGSKVIITTRQKSLATAFIIPPKIKTIQNLSKNDSFELFSLHAFPQNQPYDGRLEQTRQVIRHCENLPLALEVLGTYLRGKNNSQWEETISKLDNSPLHGIQKVVQLTYDSSLEDNEKFVFQQIARFFVGKDEDFIVKVLSECKQYPTTKINKGDLLSADVRCGNLLHSGNKSLDVDGVCRKVKTYWANLISEDDVSDYFEDEVDDITRLKDKVSDYFEDEVDDIKRLKDKVSDYFEDEVDDITRLKDKVSDYFEDEVDDIRGLKDKVSAYFEDEVDDITRLKDKVSAYFEDEVDDITRLKDKVSSCFEDEVDDIRRLRDKASDYFAGDGKFWKMF